MALSKSNPPATDRDALAEIHLNSNCYKLSGEWQWRSVFWVIVFGFSADMATLFSRCWDKTIKAG